MKITHIPLKLFVAFFFIFISTLTNAQQWPTCLVGRWTFDNPSNLLEATVGNDLLLTGTHSLAPGFNLTDQAVAIGVGSYYTCNHGIASNGGGSYVNEYSILFDIKMDNPKQYYSFIQTNQTNSNDGDIFINPNSQIGVSATGYSGFSLKANEWYRVVITVDLGSSIRFFVDGKLVLDGISQAVDGRFSLDPTLLFFADDNGEDHQIIVSQIALFNSVLENNQVSSLAGFHNSNISPYLQSISSNSVYVSWNSYFSNSTIVQYGTNTNLSQTATGSFEDIGTTGNVNRWHTAQIINLQPNTKYFYKVISGSDTSSIFHFTTPQPIGSNNGHIRFLKFGDNQTYTLRSTALVDSICQLLNTLYGQNWKDSITLITNSGDITENGLELGRFNNEFFNPFSKLTPYIPTMISIGNHEMESSYYYQFMKYEDWSTNNEINYSFKMGNSQFIFLNTNGLYNDASQSAWLEDQLELSDQDSLIDFVFTFNHQPGKSELWPDGNTSYTNEIIYPILAQYPKVVMANHGHSHCYERGDFSGSNDQNRDFRTVICGGAAGELDNWGDYTNQTDYQNIHRSYDMYGFLLVDVDLNNKSVESTYYTVGNESKPRNIQVLDFWRRYDNMPEPNTPGAITVEQEIPDLLKFSFSYPQQGEDSMNASQFQLIPLNGNFDSPLLDSIQHFENYYGDSGSPNYEPLQLCSENQIYSISLDFNSLNLNETYWCRVRYRDFNLKWSEWSEPLTFSPSTVKINQTSDFVSDLQIYPNPTSGIVTIISDYDMEIQIVNQLGQCLKTMKIESGSNILDLSLYKDGVYLIRYQLDQINKTRKIIKISK